MEPQRLKEIGLFSGVPAFEHPIHVGRPNIGDRRRLLDRVEGVLDRLWLTNSGPLVEELEARLADYLGVRHVITMCNGTVGLEIAIRALGMTGEVIVPSFTFVATAHALQWQEITPVFCDIDRDTHCLDPDRVESLVTPRTSGIIGVHIWGTPCDIDRLREVADANGLRLLFDAAHALGCTYKGRMIGQFGDAEVFSFHATKFFNTFEGGAITTNDDGLAERVRLMRNFGFAGVDDVIYLGTNGKMHEVSAAMGLTSLDGLESFVDTNRRNYELYGAELARVPGVDLYPLADDELHNYQYVVVEVDQRNAGLSRDAIVEVLWADNVRARRYFYPGVHRMEPYRSYFPHAGLLLPETAELTNRVMLLPTGTTITKREISAICDIIREALANRGRVSEVLSDRHGGRVE